MRPRSGVERAAELPFQLLLALLPARLRLARGADMAELFGDECRERYRERGWRGLAGGAARGCGDLLRVAALEHREELRRAVSNGARRVRRLWKERQAMSDGWSKDVHWALRSLLASPAFTAAAVITLGLGIGLNTALFSITWSILLQPLPVAEPERTVKLFSTTREAGLDRLSYPEIAALQSRAADAFSEVASSEISGLVLSRGAETQPLWGELVSSNYFAALPVAPERGRLFGAEVDTSGEAAAVAVLSHRTWQLHFAAELDIVGRRISLNNRSFTVVGVTPEPFHGVHSTWFAPELWLPLAAHEQLDPARRGMLQARDRRAATTVARLAPGVAPTRAQAQAETLLQAEAAGHPETTGARRWRVIPERETRPEAEMGPGTRAAFLIFHGLAGLVLLVACANVSNLLLARAAARRRELAIRIAMGAARGRLVRHLLVEALLIAGAAAGLGTLFAWKLAGRMTAFQMPTQFPLRIQIGLEWHALAFSIAVATLAALVFGLVPALRASRDDIVTVLKGESGQTTGERSRLMGGLVVAQVAVSLVLLVAAGLFLRSMQQASRLPMGFRAERLLLANVGLQPGLQVEPERRARLQVELARRLEALPGAVRASAADPVPLEFWTAGGRVFVDGRELAEGEEPGLLTLWSRVGPGYFEAMQTRIERGRGFLDSDGAGAARVVVVNRLLAEKLWPGRNPLGEQLRLEAADAPAATVVGVAENGKYNALFEPPSTFLYAPLLQPEAETGHPASGGVELVTLLVRTQGDPEALVPAVRAQVQAFDRSLMLLEVKTMEKLVQGRALVLFQLGAGFSGTMGLIALALAVVGLYGVVSLAVARRTREIGVRMALGARPREVIGMVLRQGMLFVGVGALFGAAGAAAVGQLARNLLIGVGPNDPLTLVSVAALLAAVSAVAALLPARRAARVDPIAALRQQ